MSTQELGAILAVALCAINLLVLILNCVRVIRRLQEGHIVMLARGFRRSIFRSVIVMRYAVSGLFRLGEGNALAYV